MTTSGVLAGASSQKTHYFVDPRKRRRLEKPGPEKAVSGPFTPLLNGSEDSSNVALRQKLFEHVWGQQLAKVEDILNNTNTALFDQLVAFVLGTGGAKLPVGFLLLGSNTANNLRILEEFDGYLRDQRGDFDLLVVSVNSKSCANIKGTVREIMKQFFNMAEKHPSPVSDDEEEANGAEMEAEDAEDASAALGGRISYDFDVVQEWFQAHNSSNRRLVITIQDSDSVDHNVLNQLVKLLLSYWPAMPIRLIMGLSSANVSNWINSNLNNQIRTVIFGFKFKSNDNRDLGYRVIEDLFLQHEITDASPLGLDSRLSLVILNRFENSNNSIDSLIAELKLSYMIYFYQLPLSSLILNENSPCAHIDCLRKLPSFKKYIEFRLFRYLEGKKSNENPDDGALADARTHIEALLNSDDALLDLFKRAKTDFQRYQLAVVNAINLLYLLSPLSTVKKEKFKVYKLITNNQLVNSLYLTDILKPIKAFSEDDTLKTIALLQLAENIKPSLSEDIHDNHIATLIKNVTSEGITSTVLFNELTSYFHKNEHLNKKIDDNLFNEVLTISGGRSELEALKPDKIIEENFENLMIHLVKPNLRSVLEAEFDDSKAYLGNDIVLSGMERPRKDHNVVPMVSKLYGIYKDAPISVNIYDFFTAFQESINKNDVIAELGANLGIFQDDEAMGTHLSQLQGILDRIRDEDDSRAWDKLAFAWFVQSCYELILIGLLKEKTNGDFIEKTVWKGV